MIGHRSRNGWECVLVDLNTQCDFLEDDGQCKVRNRIALVRSIRRVIAWAKRNHVPIISAVDSHREGEALHDGFPRHCIDGTPGQRKIACSLFAARIRVEGDNTLSVPLNLFEDYQQVIFRKRTNDLFVNPKADRFITQLPTDEYILFGVGLEYSVRALALGLVARGKKVSVIADACGFWNPSEANLALRLIDAKGVQLLTVDQLRQRSLRRWHRYPLRPQNGSNGSAAGNGHARARRNAKTAVFRLDTMEIEHPNGEQP